MKLLRCGSPGLEVPGVQLEDGTRIDVSGCTPEFDEAFFGGDGLPALRAWLEQHATAAPRLDRSAPLGGPPIARPSKIVCIGLNFRDHAAESGMPLPAEPVIFFKSTTALVGPGRRRRDSARRDEGRLGSRARGRDRAPRARTCRATRALDHVAGYVAAQRLLGAQLPARTRRPVGQGQERRHLRAARPVPRDAATRSPIRSSSGCG